MPAEHCWARWERWSFLTMDFVVRMMLALASVIAVMLIPERFRQRWEK